MNPFVIYALREKRNHPKMKSSEKIKKDNERTYSYENDNPKHSLSECIVFELSANGDTRLFDFFEELKKYCKAIDDSDASEYVKQVEEIKKPMRATKERLEEKKNKLVNEFENVSYHVCSTLPTYKNPTQDSEIEYIEKIDRININGVTIKGANIEKEIEERQEKYESLKNRTAEYNKEELEEKKKIIEQKRVKLENKLKNRFVDRKYIRLFNKLREVKREESDICKQLWAIADAEKIQNEIETLKNLTPEQIKSLEDFFEVNEEMNKFPSSECWEIDSHIAVIYGYETLSFNGMHYGFKDERKGKYTNALEKMLEDGKVSEEDIQYDLERIDAINEKRNELYYDQYCYRDEFRNLDGKTITFINKFLKEKDEYGLENNEGNKISNLITSKDIAESSKEKGISLSEISAAKKLGLSLSKETIEKNGGEKND